MPVVAGISYEMIRLAARTRSPLVQTLFKPGLYLQYLTTREPHDDQIEVAIEALNAAKPEDVNDQAQTCTVEIIAQETAPAASKVQDAVTSGTESA